MKSIPLVEVNSLAPFVEFLSANGGNVLRHSDLAGIPRGMMEALDGRITKVQATRFLESIREVEGIPDLGYRVGQGFGPDQMGPLGVALRRSGMLGVAIDVFAEHLSDWWGGTRAWVERGEERAWLRVAATDKLGIQRDVANQNGIFILTHLIRLAAGDHWTPTKVCIPHTEGRAHEQHPVTGEAEPDFHPEEIGVEFSVDLLVAPLLPALSPIGGAPIQAHPEDLIESISEVVREQIRHGSLPGIEVTAEFAGTSKRTLQRRLDEEGTSYRRLIDRIRFQIARDHLLSESRINLDGVALSAGFSNASALIRSFRRMAGMTPGEYVRRVRQQA